MGRTAKTLTPAQQTALDRVTALDLRLKDETPRVAARAREIAQRELAALQHEVDMAVREAFEAGVPKAEFRRREHGLHTSDTGTINRVLARTEHLAETVAEALAEVAETHSLYSFRDGKPIVTPPADELVPLARDARLVEWETELVLRKNEYDLLIPVNEYSVTDGSPGKYGALYEKKANPVCTWWEQGTHKADAREWFAEHTPAE